MKNGFLHTCGTQQIIYFRCSVLKINDDLIFINFNIKMASDQDFLENITPLRDYLGEPNDFPLAGNLFLLRRSNFQVPDACHEYSISEQDKAESSSFGLPNINLVIHNEGIEQVIANDGQHYIVNKKHIVDISM